MGSDDRRVMPDRPLSRAIVRARREGRIPLIVDIKPVSPRDGDLLGAREPAALARRLAAAGACSLSVVTEPRHFGGSVEMLAQVARAVPVPVLRKDFFSETDQVFASREAGAAAVLLIMATIPDPLAAELYRLTRQLGMEAVVEVHSRHELDRALALEPTIIGINNRNILELEMDEGDVRVTEELAGLVPDPILVLSESALHYPAEIRRALQAGADAVLVGTAVLQTADLETCLARLMRA